MKTADNIRLELIEKMNNDEEERFKKVEDMVSSFTDQMKVWFVKYTWKEFQVKFFDPELAIQILKRQGFEVRVEKPVIFITGHLWWKKEEKTDGKVEIRIPRK